MDLAGLGVLSIVAFLYYTLIYLLGKIINNQILTAGARKEILETISTIVLAILLIYSLSPFDGVSPFDNAACLVLNTFFSYDSRNICDNSKSITENYRALFLTQEGQLKSVLENLLTAYQQSGKWASTTFSVTSRGTIKISGPLSLGATYSLHYCHPWHLVNSLIGSIISSIRSALDGLYVFYLFLERSTRENLERLIVLGFILRIFPFTRPAGNLIWGIVLVLKIFLPASFMMTDSIVNAFFNEVFSSGVPVGALEDIPEDINNSKAKCSFGNTFLQWRKIHYISGGIIEGIVQPYLRSDEGTKLLLYIYLLLLAKGIAVLVMISITAGIISLFGVSISPFLLRVLGRV